EASAALELEHRADRPRNPEDARTRLLDVHRQLDRSGDPVVRVLHCEHRRLERPLEVVPPAVELAEIEKHATLGALNSGREPVIIPQKPADPGSLQVPRGYPGLGNEELLVEIDGVAVGHPGDEV